MLDIQEEVEEQVGDVVVCNKSSIEAMMQELEERRARCLWVRTDSSLRPEAEGAGSSAEVLVHCKLADGSSVVTIGRYTPASDQWQLASLATGSALTVVGWRTMPTPEYQAG